MNLQLWNETPSLPRFEDAALMGSSGPNMTNTIFRNTDAWQPLPILKFSKIGCNLGDNYPASVPAMTLHFPNQSRSFDEAKGCIRFIGHDDVFEVVFRLDIDALIKIDANLVQNEQGYITVFDLARSAIERVARRTYIRRKDRVVLLTASDIH